MLAIVIPVLFATLGVAWWYRASNKNAHYLPTWAYSGKIEIIVWSIPAMVIVLLGGIAWIGSHDLDPAKPIKAHTAAIEIDVVALDWKWLFIYPKEGVASVNRMTVPTGRPISLRLTSATVMNSFFVPQLGSQIYTMAGMTSRLNLLADHPGQYPGLSAQFSGEGFSGMRFVVDAVSQEQFSDWVEATRDRKPSLDTQSYAELAKPTKHVTPMTYGAIDADLFKAIVDMRMTSSATTAPKATDAPSTTHGNGRRGH